MQGIKWEIALWYSGINCCLWCWHPTWILVQLPTAPLLVSFMLMYLGKQWKYLAPCQPCGRTQIKYWLLFSVTQLLLLPLFVEWTYKWEISFLSFSLSLPCCLSNNWSQFFKKKLNETAEIKTILLFNLLLVLLLRDKKNRINALVYFF